MRSLIRLLFEERPFWGTATIFLLGTAVFSLGALFIAPSEVFYTDAAIEMLKTGDYLTPYFNNHLRFQKPILTYWWTAAGFHLFGVSFWSARLPFLVGGLGLLYLTYQTSLLIWTKEKKLAALAALILSVHPLLILSASRSMPDMPLVFYTSLGLYGAIGMIKSVRPPLLFTYIFYVGFALSVATKGVPGLILCVLTFLYLLVNPWQRVRWQILLSPVPLLLGLLIAFGWYAYVYVRHEEAFLLQFFKDQVGGRVVKDPYRLWTNSGRFLLTLCYALPFLALVGWRFALWKGWWERQGATAKSFVGIGVLWFLFFAITAPFFLVFYDRYIFSMIPLQSLVFASLIYTIPQLSVDKIAYRLVAFIYAITFLSFLFAFYIFINYWIVLFVLLVNLLFILFFVFLKAYPHWRIGVLLLGVYLNVGGMIAPIVHPEAEKEAAQVLLTDYAEELATHRLIFVEWERATAKFNLATYGKLRFERIEDWRKIDAISEPKLLLLPEDRLYLLDSLSGNYTTKQVAIRYKALQSHAWLWDRIALPDYKLFVAREE